jgi:4-aminobutyrate aminotransferase-like enzyme
MAKEFPLVSIKVKPVSTKFRKLSGSIPNDETIKQIEGLRRAEPLSMRGQPPVIWDRAHGVNVYDAYGNMWLDFSSGVLVTNAGHGAKKIADAIINQASKPLLHTYCFANQPRIKLAQKLVWLAPERLNKVFILSTGAETTECALKLMRTYPNFMPKQYAKDLRKWCCRHGALLCFDEVQAGFGRCGTMWGFELYDVAADLFCIGKGISSSLPISAVIGSEDVMDLFGPNEMTSTHSGNPVCCAAALASIEVIEQEKLVENAAKVGLVLQKNLQQIKSEFSDVIGFAPGAGLVAGLLMVKKGSKDPDYELAWNVINLCFQKGLLMFAPVGVGGGCVKIAPPLCISEEAVVEGCEVIREAVKEAV